jgi:predicted DNA-binding transcriptional regulator AlpA
MKLLRFNDLKNRGIVRNRVTLSRWLRDQQFPQPIRLGPNSLAWDEASIDAWLRQRRLPAPSQSDQAA